VWLHDLVTIVTEPGRPPRLRGLMVDITARKRAEADREAMEKKLLETQKLESLGVLAGGIAHDFNNLLTGILGHASLARLELPVGAPTGEALAQIEKAALRAADLCKQMLAYSGKGRFVVQSLDLNELVADTLELLQVSVSKKAALRTAFTRPLPAVSADATQLRQVVMNLVINASEALGDRTGTITVGTGRLQADAGYFATTQYSVALPPGDYVYLEVTDDGCGMSRETLARIFDPFFTTKFSGRGLGLAAVHGIIRGHQGAIKVYSEPGKGTAFRILLPATPGAAETLQRPAPAPALWRGEGIVLIIDDEPAVRQVLESMLELLGFTPESAADGALGVEKFGRDPARYAAVLLDLTMPQMDGEEAFRRLRQVRPDVKVLLMSGFNKQDAVHRFIGKGLAGFLQKPFEVSTFIAELRAVLGR
jgi:signal transduction histidine kinase/CheY-like chemotaxis protein